MTLRINLLPPELTPLEHSFAFDALVDTGQLVTHDKDLARSWPRLLEDCVLVAWWPDRWCADWRRMFEPLVIEVMPYNYYRK